MTHHLRLLRPPDVGESVAAGADDHLVDGVVLLEVGGGCEQDVGVARRQNREVEVEEGALRMVVLGYLEEVLVGAAGARVVDLAPGEVWKEWETLE